MAPVSDNSVMKPGKRLTSSTAITILLLWIGFVDFGSLFKTKGVVSENVSGNV